MNVGLLHSSSSSHPNVPKEIEDLVLSKPCGCELKLNKLYQIMVNLERLTLPYFDSQGNTLQIWKVKPSLLVGTIQDKERKLKIIPGHKIRLLAKETINPIIIIKQLEKAPIKRWDIVYNPKTLELDLWPHILGGGRDWFIGHIEVDKSPFKDMTKEQVIQKLLSDGFEFQGNPQTGKGCYVNNKTGAKAYIDVRNIGKYPKPNHVDFEEPKKTKVRLYFKDPYSTHLFKREAQIKKSPQNREFIQSKDKANELAIKHFHTLLQKTGLTKSYNASHPNSSVPKGGSSGDTGGVEIRAGYIEGLFDSPDSLFDKTHSFFIPMSSTDELPFTNQELGHILHELAMGIYVHDTVPFFSLHFNEQGHLYPVIHPAYEKTLIGQVFSILDYHMKGYLNGGIFSEQFVKSWAKKPVPLDASNSFKHLINLEHYAKTNLTGKDQNYLSANMILNEQKNGFRDYSNFDNSFRIITKQNKIQKFEDLFVLDSDFDVEYTIIPDPNYQSQLDQHYKLNGTYPQGYEDLVESFDLMKEKIHDHMSKMPLFKKYFSMLKVINFFSYYFTTLKKHGKIPLLPKVDFIPCESPPLFPPLPRLNISKDAIKYNLYSLCESFFRRNKDLIQDWLLYPNKSYIADKLQTNIDLEIYNNISLNGSNPLRRYLSDNKQKFLLTCAQLGKQLDLLNHLKNFHEKLSDKGTSYMKAFITPIRFLEQIDQNIMTTVPMPIPLLTLPAEQTREELEQGKKIMGGCGMRMHPLKVQNLPHGEQILNSIFAQAKNTPSGHLTGVKNGFVFSLGFTDAPFATSHPREMESLIRTHSSVLSHIIQMMEQDLKDKFIHALHNNKKHSRLVDAEGRILLHHAALNADCFYTSELLRLGYDPCTADEKNYLPLHYAAMSGSVDQLKLLLSYDPKTLNARSNQGATPLIVAIQHSQVDAVHYLLSQQASVETKLNDGYTTLHLAVHTGNIPIVRALLGCKISINAVTMEGITPLMLACGHGKVKLINDLLQKGADPKIKAKNGKMALDIAVKNNYFEICTRLINISDFSPDTIETAIKKSSLSINRLLATKTGYFNCRNSSGDTPLILALRYANLPLAQFLLTLDKVDWTTPNRFKETPIYFATLGGFYSIVEDLWKRDPNFIPKKQLFKLLLKGGYQGENAFLDNLFAQTVLNQLELQKLVRAALKVGNYVGVSNILVPKGANLKGLEANLAKCDALFLFKKLWSVEMLKYREPRTFKSLAYIAAENGSERILRFLLEELKKAHLSHRNQADDRHLFYAVVQSQNLKNIQAFLEQKPTLINRPLDSKKTCPIHLAAEMGNKEILFFLHNQGANLNSLDGEEKDPLFYAVRQNNQPVIDYLLENKVQVRAESIFAAAELENEEILASLLKFADRTQKEMAILQAILEPNLAAFLKFASFKISLNFSIEGISPLLVAAGSGQAKMLKKILSKMPDPSTDGNNALLIACQNGHRDCIRLLRKHGCLINHPNPSELAEDHLGALAALGVNPHRNTYNSLHVKIKTAVTTQNIAILIKEIEKWPLNAYFYLKSSKGTLLHHLLKEFKGNKELKKAVDLICSDGKFDPTLTDELGNSYAHLMINAGLDPTLEQNLPIDMKNNEGKTPLHIAAGGDNLHLLTSLIKNSHIDAIDKKGKTPLFYAIEQGKRSHVNALIKHKADLNHQDHRFRTPLLYACIFKNYPLVRLLVKGGADINQRGTVEHFSPLEFAFGTENEEITLLLLFQGAKVNPTMAHAAAESGNNPFLRLLAAKGISLLSADKNGLQPIHYAARRGKTKTLKTFDGLGISLESPVLEVGNKENKQSLASATPIHLASMNSGIEAVKWLLRHQANPEKIVEGKLNILTCSVLNTPGTTKELLSLFNEHLLSKDLKQILPALQVAISIDALHALEILHQWGIAPNAEIENGANGLHLACMHGSLQCTDFYLRNGVDWTTPTKSGETPLELSAMNSSIEQFRYLLQYVQPDLDEQNQKGETLLHLAVKANNLSHVALLIDQGADFDKQDAQGKTPLFVAAENGLKQIVELLMICDANSDVRTTFSSLLAEEIAKPEIKETIQNIKSLKTRSPEGSTPLHLAAQMQNPLALKIIASHIHINQQNVLGHTAFHQAVITGSLHSVRELFKRGADLNIKDKRGKTPFDLAKENGFLEIQNLLLSLDEKQFGIVDFIDLRTGVRQT